MACPKASFVCAENPFSTKWPPNIPIRAPTRPPTTGTGITIWPTIIPAILPPLRKSAKSTLSTTSAINSFLVLTNTPLLHFLYSSRMSTIAIMVSTTTVVTTPMLIPSFEKAFPTALPAAAAAMSSQISAPTFGSCWSPCQSVLIVALPVSQKAFRVWVTCKLMFRSHKHHITNDSQLLFVRW